MFLELFKSSSYLSIILLAFFQGGTNEIVDILGKFNTPLSVGIVLWFCKAIFSAWREDTQKAREDSQQFFATLKELIASLENERKSELNDMTAAFDNLADSIRESLGTQAKN